MQGSTQHATHQRVRIGPHSAPWFAAANCNRPPRLQQRHWRSSASHKLPGPAKHIQMAALASTTAMAANTRQSSVASLAKAPRVAGTPLAQRVATPLIGRRSQQLVRAQGGVPSGFSGYGPQGGEWTLGRGVGAPLGVASATCPPCHPSSPPRRRPHQGGGLRRWRRQRREPHDLQRPVGAPRQRVAAAAPAARSRRPLTARAPAHVVGTSSFRPEVLPCITPSTLHKQGRSVEPLLDSCVHRTGPLPRVRRAWSFGR